MNFKEWGMFKKIIAAIILLLVIWFLWATFMGTNAATQRILDLPEGSLTIENGDGELITFDIRIGESTSTFSGVDSEVIKETVIYHTSAYPASATRVFKPVSVPIAIARFDSNGEIKEVHEVPADTEMTITPETNYQHTIMASKDFFQENNISLENGSTIQ